MEVELLEIRQHMGRFPPFDALSDELLDEIAGQVEVAYFQAGSAALLRDQAVPALGYSRSGRVEASRRTAALRTRPGAGAISGHLSLLRTHPARWAPRALEERL